jgi:hypothetical protein
MLESQINFFDSAPGFKTGFVGALHWDVSKPDANFEVEIKGYLQHEFIQDLCVYDL